MSLEPAIALLAGLVALGQIPGMASAAGVLLVVIAGVGATRGGARATAPAIVHAEAMAWVHGLHRTSGGRR